MFDPDDDDDFLDGPGEDNLVAFVPVSVAELGPLMTSVEVEEVGLNKLLGPGAADHARQRWSDIDHTKKSRFLHPYTTQGKWLETVPKDRAERLGDATSYVARQYRFGCLDGHLQGFIRDTETREWFRVTRSYWGYHRGLDGFPARLNFDGGINLSEGLKRALILFSSHQVKEWSDAKFSGLATTLDAGRDFPRDDDFADEAIMPLVETASPQARSRRGRPDKLKAEVLALFQQRVAAGTVDRNNTREAEAIEVLLKADENISMKDIPELRTIVKHISTARSQTQGD